MKANPSIPSRWFSTVGGVRIESLNTAFSVFLYLHAFVPATRELETNRGMGDEESTFVDRSNELMLQPNGSAACWADLDNDGWPELADGGTVWKNQAGK